KRTVVALGDGPVAHGALARRTRRDRGRIAQGISRPPPAAGHVTEQREDSGRALVPAAGAHGVAGDPPGGGALIFAANLRKNSSIIFLALASIRREPMAAIMPPTFASASQRSSVSAPCSVSWRRAVPCTNPGTPFPEMRRVKDAGGCLSRSSILPT